MTIGRHDHWETYCIDWATKNPIHEVILDHFTDAFLVFVAAGSAIYAWRRGTELKHCYRGHSSSVHLMIPFGPNLISVDERSNIKVGYNLQGFCNFY